MIETNYDYGTEYHEGDLVEQDARAFLGVYKSIVDVPPHHHLSKFGLDVEADEVWTEFCEENLSNASGHTIKNVYGRCYEHWNDYCKRHNIHPALADPEDVEGFLANELDILKGHLKNTHDLRFRPLFRWYRWMAFNADYPHRYQPTIMAVLLGETTYDIWKTRLYDRKNNPLENNNE